MDTQVAGKNDDGTYADKTLAKSVTDLNVGAATLDAGVNGYTDKDGKFHIGAAQGLNQLQAGISTTLKSGTSQLSSGAGKLVTYMGQLSDGADTLADGTETLSSSMKQFNKSGIQKLVSALDDSDIQGMVKRAKATINAASDGSFVGGKLDGQNGESKMIFKTDEVKKSSK